MKLIKDAVDWEKYYSYANKKYLKYPKTYPCIAKIETEGGGLMGEYRAHYVIYIPDKLKSKNDAFVAGVMAAGNEKWIRVC